MVSQHRSGMKRVEVLVVLTLIIAIATLVLPAIQLARTRAGRTGRENELKSVALSLHNFHDVYKRFPEAVRRDDVGRPLASWRYHLLPYIAGFMVEVDYDQPWFDPEAKYFSLRPMECYCLPERRETSPLNTNVVGISGAGAVFGGSRINRISEFDGRTILIMEIAGFDCHWMEPGDLGIDDLTASHVHGIDGEGLLVALVDGSIGFFDKSVSVGQLRKYITSADVAARSAAVLEKQ